MNGEVCIRRFKDYGVDWFNDYLTRYEEINDPEIPDSIITSDIYTQVINDEVFIYTPQFRTRFEIGRFLSAIISETGSNELEGDINFWSWLSAYFFDLICPKDDQGVRKIREIARYIPQPGNFRRYYRHMLLAPFLIYESNKDNPERTLPILCSPPHILSEMFERLVSTQWIIQSKNLVNLVYYLYYDEGTQMNKTGAASKSDGGVRRLVKVLDQYTRTWDLLGTPLEELLSLLPDEFNKFL